MSVRFSAPFKLSQHLRHLRTLAVSAAILTGSIAVLLTRDTLADGGVIRTFLGTGGNQNFQNAGHWSGGVPDFSDGEGTGAYNGIGTDAIVFQEGVPATYTTLNFAATGNAGNTAASTPTFESFTFNANALAYTFQTAGAGQAIVFGDKSTNQLNTGNVTNNSVNTQTFSAAVKFRFGTVNAAAGAVVFNNTVNIGNDLNSTANNLIIDGSSSAGKSIVTINGALLGTGTDISDGGALIKNGTGTLVLNGASTAWNGRLVVNDGTVQVNNATSLGTTTGRTMLAGTFSTGQIAFSTDATDVVTIAENFYLGGRVDSLSPHFVNAGGSFNLTGQISLETGGTSYGFRSNAGLLTISGPITYGTASGSTTVSLSGAGDGVLASQLGAIPLGITKEGSGTWTLSAANAYTGPTQIKGGRLNVTTAHNSVSDFTLSDLATLGITRIVADQTLRVGQLTLGTSVGSAVALDLGSFGAFTQPLVNATGLSTRGTTTITLNGTGLTVGTFPLIDYAGTIGGDGFGSFSLSGLPPRVSANLSNDTAGTRVLLNVTAFNVPKWTGAVSANWDINNSVDPSTGSGSVNWKENQSGIATRYLQSNGIVDSVIFDDTASPTRTNVVLAAALSPVSATVDNSVLDYTFSGPGRLTGSTNLNKRGTGTLTIANVGTNDFTGTTTISGGTLQLGDGVTLGVGQLGTGPVINNGVLVLNRAPSEVYAFASAVSGTGSIVKQGDNTVTFTQAGTFSGAVTVAGGILQIGNASALGTTAGGTEVKNGAALDVNDFLLPLGEVVTIRGEGSAPSQNGALYNNGPVGGAATGLHNLALSGDASIGGGRRFDVRDGTLAGGGFTLTKVGQNSIYLANLGETALGNIVINSGRLAFEGNTTFGAAPGTVQVANGGELGLESSTVAQTKAVSLSGGKIVFNAGSANQLAGALTLGSGFTNTFQGPLTGTATLTLSGPISGTGSTLTKIQLGTLVLSGTNTYTGGTAISGGTVIFTATTAVPASGAIALGPNTVAGFGFDFDQAFIDQRIASTPNPATIALGLNSSRDFNFASYSQASLGAYQSVTYSGKLTPFGTAAGGTYRLGGGGGTLTYTGALTGNNTLEIGNAGTAGTVVLTGANSYTGRTTIGAGSTLILGNAAALGSPTNPLTNSGTLDLNGVNLTVGGLTGAQTPASIFITDNSATPGVTTLKVSNASGSTTYGGSIKDGANGRVLALLKDGAGTLLLNGANASTYTGGTTIAGGRLEVRTNNAQVMPSGKPLTFTGTSTFAAANNNNSAALLTLGLLSFNGGEGTVESNNINSGTGSSNVIFPAAPTRAPGATGNFTLVNTTLPATYKVTFTTAPTVGQSINGGLFFGGDNFATYDTANYVRALNYADSTALNVALTEDLPSLGTGANGKDVQISGGGFGITAQPDDTIRTLRIGGANNLTLAQGATLTVTGGILKAGSTAATISGGLGLATAGSNDLVIRTATSVDALTIAANLTSAITGGITKAGPGTLILSGTNTFTGGAWVNGGSVQFANADAIPTTGAIRLGPSTTVSFATVIDQAFLAARVPANTNAATIALAASNANDLDFSSAGLGYQAFSLGAVGAVTYSGKLTPFGNVYRLGGGGGTLTYTQSLSGANSLAVGSGGSGGVVVLAAANTHTGGTTLSAGTIRLGDPAALGSGPVTVNGGTLDLRGFSETLLNFGGGGGNVTDNSTGTGTTTVRANILSASSTFSGSINNGTGGKILSLIKDGPGTLILSKANGSNYTGGTFIAAGRLEVRTNNAQVLAAGTDLTFTGTGTFSATNNGDATVTTAGLTLGGLMLARGEATIESNQLNASLSHTLTFAAVPTRLPGATGNFTLTVANDPSLYKVAFATPPGASGASINGGLFYNFSNFLTYDTAGYARALRYTGTPDANTVDLELLSSVATFGSVADKDVQVVGGGLHITAQTTASVRTLKLVYDTNLTLAADQTLTISSGGLLKTGGGESVISGGTGLTTGGSGDLVVRTDSAFDSVTLSTPLLVSTTGGLTKSGLGTLTLHGSQPFSGGVSVNSGSLVVESDAVVPTAGPVVVSGTGNLLVHGRLAGVVGGEIQAGGTLGGSGALAGTGGNLLLDAGAALAPTGKLTLELGSGTLDLGAAAGGTGYLKFDLGTTSDQLALVSGFVNLGSGLDLDDFTFTFGTGFGQGTYVLFESATDLIGSLGTTRVLDFQNGFTGSLDFAGGPNLRQELVLTVIPEPSTASVLLLGTGALVGLGRLGRRRRHRLSH